MVGRVRVGSSSRGGGRPSSAPVQTYEGTMSGYGATRADSVGFTPRSPKAYSAVPSDKAFTKIAQLKDKEDA